MFKNILLICIGINLGGIFYYNSGYKKFFKTGFAIALFMCLMGLHNI